jgi:hypothetical protein
MQQNTQKAISNAEQYTEQYTEQSNKQNLESSVMLTFIQLYRRFEQAGLNPYECLAAIRILFDNSNTRQAIMNLSKLSEIGSAISTPNITSVILQDYPVVPMRDKV